ncbi:MAG TPA: hypothetical protein PKD28_03655 [Candidatus Saccharibacteria bacterium]|nr:hypothetical protein [Candidatus Saccharibacteria bacterium]
MWHSHFALGRDVVCGLRKGKWTIALVADLQGDGFYGYQPLEYHDEVLKIADAEPFTDYWYGPKVYRLSIREALSLSSGVQAPNIKFELSLDRLLEMTNQSVKV